MPCGVIGPLHRCPECGEIETWGPYGGHCEGCPRRPVEKMTVAEWQEREAQR